MIPHVWNHITAWQYGSRRVEFMIGGESMNIKLWILNLLGTLGEFLKALFIRGIYDQVNALLPIAYEVVQEVANDPRVLTGDEKRKEALARLSNRALEASISASLSTLSWVIESAYQKYKAEKEVENKLEQ